MRANWLRYTILDWLQQAPQTFYALLDKLWEIDQTVAVFEVVEAISTIGQTHTITTENLPGDGDRKYTLKK